MLLFQGDDYGKIYAVALGGKDYGVDVPPTGIELSAVPVPVRRWLERLEGGVETGIKKCTLFRGTRRGKVIHFLYTEQDSTLRHPMRPTSKWAEVEEVSVADLPPNHRPAGIRIENEEVWMNGWLPAVEWGNKSVPQGIMWDGDGWKVLPEAPGAVHS